MLLILYIYGINQTLLLEVSFLFLLLQSLVPVTLALLFTTIYESQKSDLKIEVLNPILFLIEY